MGCDRGDVCMGHDGGCTWDATEGTCGENLTKYLLLAAYICRQNVSGSFTIDSTPSASSLITLSLLALSDAPSNQHQVDASMQDYFLIELMQTLRHLSQVTRERARQQEEEMVANGLLPPVSASGTVVNVKNAGRLASTCARTSPAAL